MLNMCRVYFGLSGNDCTKDEKTVEEVGRLRRPNSSVPPVGISDFLKFHFYPANRRLF